MQLTPQRENCLIQWHARLRERPAMLSLPPTWQTMSSGPLPTRFGQFGWNRKARIPNLPANVSANGNVSSFQIQSANLSSLTRNSATRSFGPYSAVEGHRAWEHVKAGRIAVRATKLHRALPNISLDRTGDAGRIWRDCCMLGIDWGRDRDRPRPISSEALGILPFTFPPCAAILLTNIVGDITNRVGDKTNRVGGQMLEPIVGSKSSEQVLMFLLAREEGYATEIARFFDADLYAIQKQLSQLESSEDSREQRRGSNARLSVQSQIPIPR